MVDLDFQGNDPDANKELNQNKSSTSHANPLTLWRPLSRGAPETPLKLPVNMKNYLLLVIAFPLLSNQVRAFELQLNGRSQSYQNTYVVNDSTTIVCNVVNNTAAETLIWYRGTQQLDVDSKNSENSSTICLPALSPQDDGVSFTCLLKRNTTMKLSVQLSVTYDPILKGNTIIEGEEGKTIKMTCEFMANPAAVMSWRRNNSVVNFPARFEQQMTRDSMTLTITKAEKSDSDNYTCVAQVGNKETELVFELVVGDRIPGLPIEAIAAAVVVGALIIAFALFARRDQIFKGCKRSGSSTAM